MCYMMMLIGAYSVEYVGILNQSIRGLQWFKAHHCIVPCCVIFFFLTEVYEWVLAGVAV